MKHIYAHQANLKTALIQAGLRPTKQRLMLGKLLYEAGHRHVTAEQLYEEAKLAELGFSLATIYNTLNQFRDSGLLREVAHGSHQTWFDTNLTPHHHFYYQQNGLLEDIQEEGDIKTLLPAAPKGKMITHVEVVIHLADLNDINRHKTADKHGG